MAALATDFGSLPYPDSNGLTQRDRDYFRMVRTENGASDLVIVVAAAEKRKKEEEEERRGAAAQLEQVQINQRSGAGEAPQPPQPQQRNEDTGMQGAPHLLFYARILETKTIYDKHPSPSMRPHRKTTHDCKPKSKVALSHSVVMASAATVANESHSQLAEEDGGGGGGRGSVEDERSAVGGDAKDDEQGVN